MLGVAALWGSLSPSTGLLLREMDPFFLAASYYSLSVPFTFLLARWTDGRWPALAGVPWGRAALLGMAGVAVFASLYTLAIDWTDPVTGAAIAATSPAIAALLVRALDRTPLGARVWAGVAMAVLGGLSVALARPVSGLGHGKPPGGELMMVAAIGAWCWYSMRLGPWLGQRLTVLGGTAITMATASAGLWLIYGGLWALGFAAPPSMPPASSLALLFYVALLPTALANSLWNFAVGRLGVAVAAVMASLMPAFAALFSSFAGFPLVPGQIAGGFIIILAVIWVQFHAPKAAHDG